MLYFVNKQRHPLALGLHQHNETQEYQWFLTRSSEGTQQVLQRLQDWRSQAKPVPASDLEDPDTILVEPSPNWGGLPISELRRRLKLDRVLVGSQITKVVYNDRYLYQEAAEFLADLLEVKNIGSGTQIFVNTRDDHPNKNNAIPHAARKSQLEAALSKLKSAGATLQVDVQPYRSATLPHARTLEIYRQDGQHYRVALEKGVDFVTMNTNGTYRIKEITYLVVTQQSQL